MAYALSRTFFGWIDKDALVVASKLSNKTVMSHKYDKDSENYYNNIDSSLPDGLKLNLLHSLQNKGMEYLYFKLDNNNCSSDCEDIDFSDFNVNNLQSFIEYYNKFVLQYPDLPAPRLYTMTLADGK